MTLTDDVLRQMVAEKAAPHALCTADTEWCYICKLGVTAEALLALRQDARNVIQMLDDNGIPFTADGKAVLARLRAQVPA